MASESQIPLTRSSTFRSESTTSTGLYATGTDGCVICPSTTSLCPKCPTGQVCNQLTRTCSTCPEYVCVKSGSGGTINGKPIVTIAGGIVGGVVGLVVIVLAGLYLYYKLVYRKKNPRTANFEMGDDPDGFGSSEAKYQDSETSNGRLASSNGSRAPRSHRLSSYESFMRPPRHNRLSSTPRLGVESRQTSYNELDLSKRISVATTVSTSNASNILPIAYIPGVTIRPTKNNTRSIYLYDVESISSEAQGADSSLITPQLVNLPRNMMSTARPQPRLVTVTRIDEDEEPEDEEEDTSTAYSSTKPGHDFTHMHSNPFEDLPAQHSIRLGTLVEADAESDSDVDSDIGEIRRATSTRRQGIPESDHVEDFDDTFDEDQGSFVIPIIREQ